MVIRNVAMARFRMCRVVAVPLPKRIVEEKAVKQLLDAGIIVITVGGGGIPVFPDEYGHLHGVPAVIDKDFASSLLASNIGAELLVITTAVEKVALYFGRPWRPRSRLRLTSSRMVDQRLLSPILPISRRLSAEKLEPR